MSKRNKSSKTRANILDKERDIPKEKTYLTKEIETSITILDSPEVSVVIDALMFLSKYADLSEDNLLFLQSHGILNKLLNLFRKPLPIVRLTLRLLGLLLTKDVSVYELDKEEHNDLFLEITEMFITNPDASIKELSAGILAKMAKSARIVTLIFKADLFSPIFNYLTQSVNIELLNNVMELLYNLLDAPTSIVLLSSEPSFDPKALLTRMDQYEEKFQTLILEFFRKVTYAGVDQMQHHCKECRLVETMMKMIVAESNPEYYDIVFDIVFNCLQNEITHCYFIRSIEFLEFCKWSNSCSGKYLLLCAVVFEKLSSIPSIRQILFDLSVEDNMLFLLRSKDKKVLQTTCHAISNMTAHRYCCTKMATPVVIKEFLRMIHQGDSVDASNEDAIRTLYSFCKRYSKTIDILDAYKGTSDIFQLFYLELSHVSPQTYKQILEMIILMLPTPTGQQAISSNQFYTTLCKQFQYHNDEISLLCLEIMTYCISYENFKEHFIQTEGSKILINILTSTEDKILFKSILIFIYNNLIYKDMAKAFLKANLILVLKHLPAEIQTEVPLIKRTLNLVYNLFLPLKFYETNRLDVGDRIKHKFYIIKGVWSWVFPFLEVLESQYVSTKMEIYLVDFSYQSLNEPKVGSNMSVFDAKTSKAEISYHSNMDTNDIFSLARDPYLLDYVIFLKKHISEELSIADQVKLVATFVNIQMCGPKEDYSEPQKLHTHKLHFESLRKKLETNVIPIGYIKIGFQCERSLLFKALCDKLSIPCALVRGSEKNYWNEVPLIFPGMCNGYLRYYVVDLMNHIGELYLVGSRDANVYCCRV